jgi:hypothetical protein
MSMRILARVLGLGAAAFGLVPALFPGWFGALFGIDSATKPTVATAIRSVGVRDLLTGLALVQAAGEADPKALHRWILVRAGCDAGDVLAVVLAVVAGVRNRRFTALGGLALGAAAFGFALASRAAGEIEGTSGGR